MNPITVKIDVTKIDKARLFKGEKGTYLDLVLLGLKNPDKDRDYMVVQSVSKEEREAGVQGPILGNAKVRGLNPDSKPAPKSRPAPKPVADDLEGVPF